MMCHSLTQGHESKIKSTCMLNLLLCHIHLLSLTFFITVRHGILLRVTQKYYYVWHRLSLWKWNLSTTSGECCCTKLISTLCQREPPRLSWTGRSDYHVHSRCSVRITSYSGFEKRQFYKTAQYNDNKVCHENSIACVKIVLKRTDLFTWPCV